MRLSAITARQVVPALQIFLGVGAIKAVGLTAKSLFN